MGNKPFSFGSEEFKKTQKVFLWTVASAVIVLVLDLIKVWNVPAEYAFVVPLVNTTLYALKEWIEDNRTN